MILYGVCHELYMSLSSIPMDLFFSFMDLIFSSLINFKIEVLSLGTDFKSCANECSQLEGHIPYTFEGKRHLTSTTKSKFITVSPIVDRLYKNDSIDRTKFPITQERRRVKTNERDFIFHLNAHFDFENLIWKSGIFKIPKNKWRSTDTDEYRYPILGKICYESKAMIVIMLSTTWRFHNHDVSNITVSTFC